MIGDPNFNKLLNGKLKISNLFFIFQTKCSHPSKEVSDHVCDVGGAGAGGVDAGVCDRAGVIPALWARGDSGYLVSLGEAGNDHSYELCF